MGKIVAFLLATAALSFAILVPTAIWWNAIVLNLQEAGLIVPPLGIEQLWQGFAILAFVVIVSVVTLMLLIVFWSGESNVVR